MISLSGFTSETDRRVPLYQPPEHANKDIVMMREDDEATHAVGSRMGDVWSFGMTMIYVSFELRLFE